MRYNFQVALGLEVYLRPECVEIRSRLDDSLWGEKAGVIHPGYASDQVRLCTGFSNDSGTLQGELNVLREKVERVTLGSVLYSAARQTEYPSEAQSSFWQRSEIRALTMPLHDPTEGNSHSTDLYQLAHTASCVVDIDVSNQSPSKRILLWNRLNAVSPCVLRVCDYQASAYPRHRALRYAGRPERVPTGWEWQSTVEAYQEKILPLTKVFAQTESRARLRSLLSNGLFHFAQLLTVDGREVVRWWVLPTMQPARIFLVLKQVEDWLNQTALIARVKKKQSSDGLLASLPPFQGWRIPVDQSSRLYMWESH